MKKEFTGRFVKNPVTGRSLDTYVLNNIFERVQERIPSLPYNKKLPLSKVCGDDFWEQLDEWEKIEAGCCMSYLVLKKRVPMVAAGYDCHFALVYLRVEMEFGKQPDTIFRGVLMQTSTPENLQL